MHTISTTVNNLLTTLPQRRPLSLMAAAALPVSSFVFVHHAAESFLPASLVAASLGIMVAIEWLQWTALDRIDQLERARDDDRAQLVKCLAAGVGLMQVAAYTLTLILFAAEAGMVWGSGFALAGCIAASVMFAALNFFGKHAYADSVRERTPARRWYHLGDAQGAGLPLAGAAAAGLAVIPGAPVPAPTVDPAQRTSDELAALKAEHAARTQAGRNRGKRHAPRFETAA